MTYLFFNNVIMVQLQLLYSCSSCIENSTYNMKYTIRTETGMIVYNILIIMEWDFVWVIYS